MILNGRSVYYEFYRKYKYASQNPRGKRPLSAGKKIPLFEIVISLISTFSVCGKKKSIADIHRNFVVLTGKNVSRSSFWDRLANKKLLDFIEKAVLDFSCHMHAKALSKLSWLSIFNDILLFDASPVRLPKGLSEKYPGNRKNHSPACFKLSALFSLRTKSAEWIHLSPQKHHDSKFLPNLKKMAGSLFLFDLGYFSHSFLNELNQTRVWFVCRLKANSLPIITKIVNGIAKRHIGKPLTQNINFRGSIVEAWGKFNLPDKKSVELRLIGFRFPKTKKYRWYVTNLPKTMMLAEWIYPIYRLRWQIELFFKSIKSMLNADQITSENENIALTICYSSILSSLIADSVIIEQVIILAKIEIKSITVQRIMHVYSLIAHNLAQCFLRKNITSRCVQKDIGALQLLLICPNRNHRPTSLEYVVMLNNE